MADQDPRLPPFATLTPKCQLAIEREGGWYNARGEPWPACAGQYPNLADLPDQPPPEPPVEEPPEPPPPPPDPELPPVEPPVEDPVDDGLEAAIAEMEDLRTREEAAMTTVLNLARRRRRVATIPADPPDVLQHLVLLPVSITIQPTETAQVVVTGLDQFGNELLDLTGFVYESSNGSLATVDSSGLVTGVSAGSGTITVTHTASGLSDAIDFVVQTPNPTVDHVLILPSSMDLTAGGAGQAASGEPQDASNNTIAGLTMTWETESGNSNTISFSGASGYDVTVDPVAAGTDRFRAVVNSVPSAWITATVVAAPSDNEPPGFTEQILTDCASLAELAAAGFNNSAMARASFLSDPDFDDPPDISDLTLQSTYPSGTFGGSGAINTSAYMAQRSAEVFHDWSLKLSDNFYGNNSGVNKKMFWGVGAPTGNAAGNPVYYSTQGVGNNSLVFQVRLQNCPDNIGGNSGSGARNIGSGKVIVRGQKYRIQVYMKMNSVVGGVPQPDGLLKVWIDGVLYIDVTNLCIRGTAGSHGSADTDVFKQIKINDTWGGGTDTIPVSGMYNRFGHCRVSCKVGAA